MVNNHLGAFESIISRLSKRYPVISRKCTNCVYASKDDKSGFVRCGKHKASMSLNLADYCNDYYEGEE